MTRREWLLIAHTMRDQIAETPYQEHKAWVEAAARALADAIDKYEREPSDRWLRRHPGEPPENYRSAFDKARFLQECGLGTEPETGL